MIDIKIHATPSAISRLSPEIHVIGVGGAGGNAVENMIVSGLEGCRFLVCNTDSQALEGSSSPIKIQLGATVTAGLGAGSRPEVGRAAAEESLEEILRHLDGANMVFVTAGMGGGTGTGAAPVIARACRERGILTVGVVTKPFHFEGARRMGLAEAGLAEMQDYVDTLIVIPNQNLFRIANERTTFAEGFRMADSVLQSGVRGVTDLMVRPGLVNLDFADIRTAMQEMGKAMMGTGEATGERRAIEAAEAAINNPLLDDVSMKGARGVIINVTGGYDMTLFETDEACNRVRDEVDPQANIIFGATFDDTMEGRMRVSIVATGIEHEAFQGRRGDQESDSQGSGAGGGTAPRRTISAMQPRFTPAPVHATPIVAAKPYPMAPEYQNEPESVQDEGELFEQNVFVESPATPNTTPLYGARHGGVFIPPRPVEVNKIATASTSSYHKRIVTPAPSAAFSPQNTAASRSSSVMMPPVAAQPHQNPSPLTARRNPSLLERLTGMGGGGYASHQQTLTSTTPPIAQGSLDMRAPMTVSEEEDTTADGLDIPAFLRRQAN